MDAGPLETQIAALDAGTGFLDVSAWRRVEVTGADAEPWLDGLVTAGVARLRVGTSTRSLLLTPTGRVRADFFVFREPGSYVLLQPKDQPAPVDELLRPYVLSSDVEMRDGSGGRRLYVFPRANRDFLITADPPPGSTCTEVEGAVFEMWRIRRGIPRFPVDFDQDSLPAEAGLESAIDVSKGCFLGQESVARVRNLGHPPRVVRALRANALVAPGDELRAGADTVGLITSAAPVDGGSAVLARVRWGARADELLTVSGVRLTAG
jgi:folate-binding protein YgfZ